MRGTVALLLLLGVAALWLALRPAPALQPPPALCSELRAARVDAVAAALPGGDVLVAGGFNGSGYLASAELYHPRSQRFTSLSSRLVTPQDRAVAAALPGGRVLIAGGFNDSGPPLALAERFSARDRRFFRLAASLLQASASAVAAPLSGGRVLIAGGQSASGRPLRSAELYLPSGAFVPLDPVGCSRPAGLPAAAGASPGL